MRDDVWEMFDLLDRVTHRDGSLRPLSATLLDPLGRVIVSSEPDIHPLGAQRAELIAVATLVTAANYDLADDAVTLSQVLEYQGRPLGTLVIDFDTTDSVAERERTVAILVIGNTLATLIADLVGFAVIRRVLRPVARLTDAMGQSADVLQPIPEEAVPDATRKSLNSTSPTTDLSTPSRSATPR